MNQWIKEIVDKAKEAETEEQKRKDRLLHEAEVVKSMASSIVKTIAEEVEKQVSAFNEEVGSNTERRFLSQRIPGRGIRGTKATSPSVRFKIERESDNPWIDYEAECRRGTSASTRPTSGQWTLKLDTSGNVILKENEIPCTVEEAVERFLRPLFEFSLGL
jgi:hypothetical protein